MLRRGENLIYSAWTLGFPENYLQQTEVMGEWNSTHKTGQEWWGKHKKVCVQLIKFDIFVSTKQSSRVFFGGGGLVTTLEGTFPFSSVFRSRIFSSCIFVIAKNWCWKKSGLVWVWVCLVLFCFVLSAWGFKKFFKKLVWFVSSFWNEPFPKNVCFQETSEKCWYLNRIF